MAYNYRKYLAVCPMFNVFFLKILNYLVQCHALNLMRCNAMSACLSTVVKALTELCALSSHFSSCNYSCMIFCRIELRYDAANCCAQARSEANEGFSHCAILCHCIHPVLVASKNCFFDLHYRGKEINQLSIFYYAKIKQLGLLFSVDCINR